MTFFLNLFTPETWKSFQEHGARVSGFRARQRRLANERVKPGDMFLCYLVRLSRWCGALEVVSPPYEDETPIYSDPDPFVIRFQVKPVVILSPEQAIPIFEPALWSKLSETRDSELGSTGWTGYFRSSLRELKESDGRLLLTLLQDQARNGTAYPLTARDRRQLARKLTVRTLDREVAVEVPDQSEEDEPPVSSAPPEVSSEARQSIQIQAKVAQIGASMGFRIWVPRSDRARVLEHCPPKASHAFLDSLPLNYDDTTLRTVENIDVLWLKGRSMARAFEIEHTTAIYSGILRMADLLALQPNMNIRLHIVAPDEKRDKVLRVRLETHCARAMRRTRSMTEAA